MDLNELKALMAASIFSGYIAAGVPDLGMKQISEAAIISQHIWEEVLKQEREN